MTFTCIGKRRDGHGQIVPCTNTSDTPTGAGLFPENGNGELVRLEVYLCAECSGTRINGARPQYNPDILDVDKPNEPEEDSDAEYQGYNFELSEQEEIENLEELDIE